MRIGICSIHQSLTPEATNLIKLAITLARRRGHAQVTPLHVASAMLASPTSLFRTACIQSHSHPLQLKALELCFNVALNRLQSSVTSPLLGHQTMSSYYPSFSNALVAAFKRAQTHQRRGGVENQQQPILALRIEIEQLVISILDDPSVSRVMREAGFSSLHVKDNVEQVVSLDFCTQNLKEIRSKPLALNATMPKYASPSSQYEATSKIRHLCSVDLSLKIESDMFDQPQTKTMHTDSMTSKLPAWLQQSKDESECKPVNSPLLKRTRITEKDLMLSMSTPCSPTSVSSNDQQNITHLSWPAACEFKEPPKDKHFLSENDVEPETKNFIDDITSKPDLLSNPNSSPNSVTSSEVDMNDMDEDDLPKFKELCNTMKKNGALCQKDAYLDIANTVLKCRSRVFKRKGSSSEQKKIKEDTWSNIVFGSCMRSGLSLDLNIAAAADEQLNSLSLSSAACNGILESKP